MSVLVASASPSIAEEEVFNLLKVWAIREGGRVTITLEEMEEARRWAFVSYAPDAMAQFVLDFAVKDRDDEWRERHERHSGRPYAGCPFCHVTQYPECTKKGCALHPYVL